MILCAQTIREWCDRRARRPMISPFFERTRHRGKTYGLSAAGYDVRIAQDIIVWPFWGRLASTVERFDMPDTVMAIVHDKSTWARRFVLVQNTVIEPGWRGYLTLELTRFLPWPVFIRAGTPIAQLVFHELDYSTSQPYEGKYQDQPEGPVAAIEEK